MTEKEHTNLGLPMRTTRAPEDDAFQTLYRDRIENPGETPYDATPHSEIEQITLGYDPKGGKK